MINILLFFFIMCTVLISQIPKSAYVVNTLGESMSIIDLQNQIVLQPSTPLGLFPNDIHIRDERAFVINSGLNEIRIFDLNTQNSLGGIDLGSGTNPYRLDFVNDSIATVSMWLVDSVYFVNVNSRQIIQRMRVGTSPEGIKYYQGKVFVANSGYTAAGYEPGKVSVINLANYSITDITVSTNPQSLDIDSQGNLIVGCSGDYQSVGAHLDIIDISQSAVIFSQAVNIPQVESIWKIAVNRSDLVYLGTFGSGVLVYDAAQRMFVRDENNPLSGGPSVAFDHQENAYITNFTNDTVHVFSPAHQLMNSYLVGSGPISIAIYDPSPTLISPDRTQIPQEVTLYQNYPNPFNPDTRIQFRQKKRNYIQLRVYNVSGQMVRLLIDDAMPAGIHEVTWDGKDRSNTQLPSGIYFYQLKVGEFEAIKRMILLK
jgi:hypothetical protein